MRPWLSNPTRESEERNLVEGCERRSRQRRLTRAAFLYTTAELLLLSSNVADE